MRKFGRLPRTYDLRIPQMTTLRRRLAAPPPPPPDAVDWTTGRPVNWGMMLNDRLGDCTCAAAYHAMQLWSSHGRARMLTEPDAEVLQMYEQFCGYDPADPATDQGGVEQAILTRWHKEGVPVKEGTAANPAPGRSRLLAFIEIDPANHDDVKRAIDSCGVVYLGFNVPKYIMDNTGDMPWDLEPQADNSIVGGHAVIAPGYDAKTLKIVSWGLDTYSMTWPFWDKFVDEAYAPAHPWWIDATGRTPLGMSPEELEAAMAALAEPAPS